MHNIYTLFHWYTKQKYAPPSEKQQPEEFGAFIYLIYFVYPEINTGQKIYIQRN